jgi:hypothetical protein
MEKRRGKKVTGAGEDKGKDKLFARAGDAGACMG